MKLRILFSIFSCLEVHDNSAVINATDKMIVLFIIDLLGFAKVKISYNIDNDSRQLKEFQFPYRLQPVESVANSRLQIMEEPDRHCLPVPRQFIKHLRKVSQLTLSFLIFSNRLAITSSDGASSMSGSRMLRALSIPKASAMRSDGVLVTSK